MQKVLKKLSFEMLSFNQNGDKKATICNIQEAGHLTLAVAQDQTCVEDFH